MSEDKTPKNPSQELTKPEALTGDLIVAASDFAARVQALQGKTNIVTPIVQISSLALDHAVNLCVVKIDPTVDSQGNGPMCYRDKAFMKEDERGLGRIGLDMIAAAAGISWLPHPHSRRTDDGRTPYLWSFTVVGAFTAMDGTIQTLPPGSAEVDLRDGSDQIGGWTPAKWRANNGQNIGGWSEKRVHQARRFGLALAETKARLRAIRSLGIRQKYSVAELAKPFLIPRVSYKPDMSNPVVAETVTRMKMGGISALYAQQTTPALLEPSTSEAMNPAAVAASTPADTVDGDVVSREATPAASGFKILKVFKEPREGQDPLYFITTEQTGDERLYTDDLFLAQAAKAHAQSGEPCDLSLAERNGKKWVEELIAIRTGEVHEDSDEGGHEHTASNGQRFVTDIKEFKGTTPAKGDKPARPWTKRTIIFNTGEHGVTFKDDLAKIADEAWKKKLPVNAVLEDNEQYPDQKNLTGLTIVGAGLPATEEL